MINVTFEIPKEILEGLASGTYERVGGVIREVDSKKVVTWLSEIGEAVQESGLPDILRNQQILMGLQVVNLAVSAVGLVMIYQKLKQVERQLQNLDGKIDKLQEGQEWLDKKLLISHLAPLISSIKTIQSVHNIQNKQILTDKLVDADNKLSVESEYFRHVLGEILVGKLESDRPEEFAACYRAWCMANQGLVNTMVSLREMSQAISRLNQFKSEHGEFGKRFQLVRQDYMRRVLAGEKGRVATPLLSQLGQQMIGVHDLIKGQELQLGYMEQEKLEPLEQHSGQSGDYLVFQVQD